MYTINHPEKSVQCTTLAEVFFKLNDRETVNYFVLRRTGDVSVCDTLDGRIFPVAFDSATCYPQLHDHTSAIEHLQVMLQQVTMRCRHPNGRVMQPQEMPECQWSGLRAIKWATYGLGVFTSAQLRGPHQVNGQTFGTIYGAYEALFERLFGYPVDGPVHGGIRTEGSHEAHVALALLRGEQLPAEVLTAYQEKNWQGAGYRHVQWIDALLKRPFLQGQCATPKHLNFLLMIEGKPDSRVHELTTENIGYLSALLKRQPADSSYQDLDDAFFTEGILLDLPQPARTLPAGADQPVNDFARALHEAMVQSAQKAQQEDLQQRIASKSLSQREIWRMQSRIANMATEHSFLYPNRLAQAITNRDMHFLIDILDSSINLSSQRTVKKVYGIQLEKLSSPKRVREIFRLAGYVQDADYEAAKAVYDGQVAAAAKARLAVRQAEEQAQRLPHARQKAACVRVRYDGKVVNGHEFVDAVVASGFTCITTRKQGAVNQYLLTNPDQPHDAYKLNAGDGTLDYARCVLEQRNSAVDSEV